MSTSKRSERQRPGVVPTMGAAPVPPMESEDHTIDAPLEMVVHSSNVMIGETTDGKVVFQMLLPIGVKITVPFPKDTWEDVCRSSLAPHVAVAREMPRVR